jgi:hypothetical protein
MTNTAIIADLTGMASALISKYMKIATDACSLSQIRKQILSPEMQ